MEIMLENRNGKTILEYKRSPSINIPMLLVSPFDIPLEYFHEHKE